MFEIVSSQHVSADSRPPQFAGVQVYLPGPEDRESTPYLTKDTSRGAQLALWSIRKWVMARLHRRDLSQMLKTPYERAGMPDGLLHLDESMQLLAAVAHRKVVIECTCKSHISGDEWVLLKLLRALESDRQDIALEVIARLVPGGLCSAVCRSFQEYLGDLTGAGMDIRLTNPTLVNTASSVTDSPNNRRGCSATTKQH